MDIRGYLHSSLIEWEGRITPVVFTAGCNWRCPYCHGWRFVKEWESLNRITEESIIEHITKYRKWFDGIVISGGEPTLQTDLLSFLEMLNELELQVKLETNGSNPDVIEILLERKLIQCLCIDFKMIPDERLNVVAGVSVNKEAVNKTFRLAKSSTIEREYHTTLCPKFISIDVFREMSDWLECTGLWVLQQYEPDDVLCIESAGTGRYTDEELNQLEAIAKERHHNVLLRKGRM